MNLPKREYPLKNLKFLLVYNDSDIFSDLFYNKYSPDVVVQYKEALEILGAECVERNLEQAINELNAPVNKHHYSGIVNLCAAFSDIQSEGIIPSIAALSLVPCLICPLSWYQFRS